MEKCSRCVENEAAWYQAGELTSSIAHCEICGLWYVKYHLAQLLDAVAEQRGVPLDDLRQEALEFQQMKKDQDPHGIYYDEDHIIPDLRQRWAEQDQTSDTLRRTAFTFALAVLMVILIFMVGCSTPVKYRQTTWDKVPPGTEIICGGPAWHGGDVFVRFPDGEKYVVMIDNGEGSPDYRQRHGVVPVPHRFETQARNYTMNQYDYDPMNGKQEHPFVAFLHSAATEPNPAPTLKANMNRHMYDLLADGGRNPRNADVEHALLEFAIKHPGKLGALTCYHYAFAVVKGPWAEAEPHIKRDPKVWRLYHKNAPTGAPNTGEEEFLESDLNRKAAAIGQKLIGEAHGYEFKTVG